MKTKRMSANQQRYVAYIAEHPSCCAADVDRACRVNPRAGHKWVYDGVKRLLDRGLIVGKWEKGKRRLFVAK